VQRPRPLAEYRPNTPLLVRYRFRQTVAKEMYKERRVVEEQRLDYAATVCPDTTPNLSPRGTTAVWDNHLVFADIRSPLTVENLRHNPADRDRRCRPRLAQGVPLQGHGYGPHGRAPLR
jgi:hypothetical protein